MARKDDEQDSWLRDRDAPDDGKVGFAELFFDLIFVFTVIQLSHTLAGHYSPLGVVEAVVMIFAVWWVWIDTTWATNWLDPDRLPVRGMLFVLMFGGLLLSASIPDAFGAKGLMFALAYVSMQVGRSLFTLYALRRRDRRNYRNFQRITCWLVFSGLFWIAGGLAEQEVRLALWLMALFIDYLSAAVGFPVPGLGRSTVEDWNVSGSHMAERCALFVIICLGETILVTGRTFAEMPFTVLTLVQFAGAFLATVTLWWIYFQFGHEKAAERIEESDQPGDIARRVFTYAHIPIVAGIILSAVAVEFMLAHPHGHTDFKAASAMIGGPAVFLLGNIWFKWAVYGRMPLSHQIGLGILAALVVTVPFVEPFVLFFETVAALMVVAGWEYWSLQSSKPAEQVDG
ncbi:low temperature requirement protein A [Pararhizobium sp.]|uniref:low temperature requirement protein A n=1 Tax=Pararhizobium sp. TaxID=1977563 RepID=UPI002723DD6A|nr:low temperature requirement protein A [Pararhizobium sp.]MDO9418963.1 low temperature requirement protein A [Pararhizobium sp.]